MTGAGVARHHRRCLSRIGPEPGYLPEQIKDCSGGSPLSCVIPVCRMDHMEGRSGGMHLKARLNGELPKGRMSVRQYRPHQEEPALGSPVDSIPGPLLPPHGRDLVALLFGALFLDPVRDLAHFGSIVGIPVKRTRRRNHGRGGGIRDRPTNRHLGCDVHGRADDADRACHDRAHDGTGPGRHPRRAKRTRPGPRRPSGFGPTRN